MKTISNLILVLLVIDKYCRISSS